jgi:hypothetical protein
MFFLVALTVWTAMNAYVGWRIATVPAISRRAPRGAVWVAIALLALTWLSGEVIGQLGSEAVGRVLDWIGGQWFGAAFLFVVTFFVADLVTGFGWLLRRHRDRARTLAFAAGVVLVVIAAANALRPPVIRNHDVAIANLPAERDGTVIAVLSDLHLGNILGARWMAARAEQVAAMHPDMIVLVGDIAEGHGPVARETIGVLRTLRAPLGVWAVPGNHERHGEGAADAFMKSAGIRLLRDQWEEAAPGLVVAGVDTVGHDTPPGRGLVSRAVAGVPPNSATILLSHYPEQVDVAARSGVGLMLSGHTHGGQIWPFSVFVRAVYRYIGGRYAIGDTTLIVCRGTGTWGPRMRLWRPNEILRVTLRSGPG